MSRGAARLLAPVGDPQKVICVGLNYHDHCREQAAKVPREPLIFSKFPSAIAGPFDDIVHPQDTNVGTPGPPRDSPPVSPHPGMALPAPLSPQELDWEVELAAVIGKSGRHIEVPRTRPCLGGSPAVSPVPVPSPAVSP